MTTREIRRLRASLAGLIRCYGEAHPEVPRLRHQLAVARAAAALAALDPRALTEAERWRLRNLVANGGPDPSDVTVTVAPRRPVTPEPAASWPDAQLRRLAGRPRSARGLSWTSHDHTTRGTQPMSTNGTTPARIPAEPCPDCYHGRRPVPPYTVDDLRAEADARIAANDDAAAAARAERRRGWRERDLAR